MQMKDEAGLLTAILIKQMTKVAIQQTALAVLSAYPEYSVNDLITQIQRSLSTDDISRQHIAQIILEAQKS